jgi:ribosomal-protein-alanine N-acetyltransferase
LSFSMRNATIDDLDDLVMIEAECFTNEAFTKNQLEYCLKSSDFITLVALLDEAIIGFITGSIEILVGETAGHIYTLDIKQCHREKGFGGKLLDAFESVLARKGVGTIYLEVRIDNIPARRLYSKRGYKPLRTLKDYYEPKVDGVMLRKTLTI